MKILLAHSFYNQAGGEDRVVETERALLARHGHEVHAYFRHNREIDGLVGQTGAALGASFNFASAMEVNRLIRNIRPDVVHVHNFFPTISPAIFYACRAAGVPVVLTLHNYRILCPTAFLYPDPDLRERSLRSSAFWTVPRRTYRGSLFGTLAVATMVELHKSLGTWRHAVDAFIALSPTARDKFIEGGLPPEKIWVKPNCVADGGGEAAGQPRSGGLFVGRLSPEKGVATLLRAWERVPYPLTVVGDGPMRKDVEQSAAAGRLRYLGPLAPEDVRREMRRAEFLVMPSEWNEMFALTVAEAYCESLPVIAAAIPGMRAMVEEAGAGFCFPPGDAAALSAVVQTAMRTPDLLREMGARARRIYFARYAEDANHEMLVDVYRTARRARAAAA